MMHSDDEHLAAVREVYDWDHERLWRAVFAFSGGRHVADDAVMESFVLAARQGIGSRDLTGSIWRSAFTIARGQVARETTEGFRSGGDTPEPMPTGPDDERVTIALTALDDLTDTERQLFAWSHVGGWTAKEIAPHVNMRATTIRVRLRRATERVPGLPTDRPGPFDLVRVPDQWDDIVRGAWSDEPVEPGFDRRRQRRWAIAVAVTAVVALVGGLVVVTGAPDDATTTSPTPSPPAAVNDPGSGPGSDGALPGARIGGTREVTLPISDVNTGATTGTFRLRLYETGGATFLEYEDIDVAADERAAFEVVEVDGRLRSRTPYTPGSIGALRMSDGTLTDPFRIRISLTDAADRVVQESALVEVTPER
jgi:RNA polymerase sigma-70 factor, ECF subfamily